LYTDSGLTVGSDGSMTDGTQFMQYSPDGNIFIGANLSWKDEADPNDTGDEISMWIEVNTGYSQTTPTPDELDSVYLVVGTTPSDFQLERGTMRCGGLGTCVYDPEYISPGTLDTTRDYFSHTIDSNRVVTNAEASSITDYMKISSDGDVMVSSIVAGDYPDFYLYMKKSTGMTNADLAVTFNYYGAGYDSSYTPTQLVFQERGVFDGSGGITITPVAASYSPLESADTGTYSVSDGGTFTVDGTGTGIIFSRW